MESEIGWRDRSFCSTRILPPLVKEPNWNTETDFSGASAARADSVSTSIENRGALS
jgi:hypothetical protein